MDKFISFIPPLSHMMRKGDGGRVGVVGGSFLYTGAPFYAGISSLRAGGDLCFVLCYDDAASAIKSYSPELMVAPILDEPSPPETTDQLDGRLLPLLRRCNGFAVGCGLGRTDSLSVVGRVLELARANHKAVVLDADALNPVLVEKMRGYKTCILTPNQREFASLCSNYGIIPDEKDETVKALAARLGNVTVLKKGLVDVISDGVNLTHSTLSGSVRRCGGQGDILAGITALFLSYTLSTSSASSEKTSSQEDHVLLAAAAAADLVRKSAEMAFHQKKRGMLTTDMIDQIPAAYELLLPNANKL